MRVLAAAALYFVTVFAAGLLLGPARVLLLEPRFGKTVAVLVEAPFLLVAMVVAARFSTRHLDVGGNAPALLGLGVAALALQQAADIVVGTLRGMTMADHFAQFATVPGVIYGVLLLAFVLMPWAARKAPSPFQS